MRYLHFTCAFLLVAAALAPAQTPSAISASSGPTAYTVFLRGTPIGREDVSVRSDADGTTVVTEGRMSAPADLVIRRAEFKYAADWTPQSFLLDANAGGAELTLRTTIANGSAVTQGSQAGKPVSFTHAVSPRAIVHANGIFGSYVALARRLAGMAAGSELRMYIVPQAEITVRVADVQDERVQLGPEFLEVRRYELVFMNPGGELTAQLTAGGDGRLIGVSIPAQGLNIVRADLSASTARTQVYSNPRDEAVIIPATGFNLGATITPPSTPAARMPAVILVSGSGAPDRDGFALGVPIIGQLAGALADAGFLTVRYDKRGYGQSGGRAESATINDFAEDTRAIFRWLSNRKDVDRERIALLGHGDGAWVALITAARERRIAGIVLLAAPASTGAELVLEQQQLALDRLTLAPEERARRVALQTQIQSAVLTGRGWDDVPPEMRKAADTPWFQSMLAFDPRRVIDDIRQPLLLVHGTLDRQIPVAHLDRLAALAREESDSKSILAVSVQGANHLLVPATTAEISDASLGDSTVSAEAVAQITAWLTHTFQAVR